MFKAEFPTVIEDSVSLSAHINPAAKKECNASTQEDENLTFRPGGFTPHDDPDNVTTTYKEKEGTCPHFDEASSTRVVNDGTAAVNDHFNCWLLDALKNEEATREQIRGLLKDTPKNCKLRAAIRVWNKLKPSPR